MGNLRKMHDYEEKGRKATKWQYLKISVDLTQHPVRVGVGVAVVVGVRELAAGKVVKRNNNKK